MNMGFDLKLSQEQKLVMTMEMQQSIKLLQMSSYELLQHIDKELQENVVLDIDNNVENLKEDNFKSNELAEYRNLVKYLEFDSYSSRAYSQDEEKEQLSPLNFISNKPTLKDYLKDQVMYSGVSKPIQYISNYIIDNIDGRGYLDEEIVGAVSEELNVSLELVEKGLEIIQSFEPAGIGARNLSECLKIQLGRKGIHDEILNRIIDEYLLEISKGKYQQLSKILNILPKQVQEYEDIIKELEPKPSRGFFTGEEIGYVVPDVYVRKLNDEYIVLMNEGVLPKLMINNTYKKVLEFSQDKNTIEYVKEKISSAMFLIKSIESRKNTLCRVMEEVVKSQREYFDKGDDYLKPMTIKYIAQKLDMHESTVSRAIRDKYVALNSGEIKRIKSLFTSYVNIRNEEVSVSNVKKDIERIIEGENKNKPFSDSVICEQLNKQGIDISRRTVAKYREELGIKSSSQRKRLV
ncbi:RNA polymerase factor sigma-54 [Clostridium culturomicium]|uniref:RNA polymerase factor sigma-54 n=1 Tax=Clostridium culturomicium TaxID=1499683 RepID=UPI00058DDCCD|nr:RNA polymerase factor sigma-54 [Clostridium culturomicium]